MRMLEKWFEPVVIVAMLMAIIGFVFADVVARFAFSTSVSVANEMARFCFVYMIYFGISYAIRERRHMRVTIVLDALPSNWRRWVFACSEAVFLIYSVVVCWLGVVITEQSFDRGRILSSTEWPLGMLYAAIIFSGALSAGRLAYSLWLVICRGDDDIARNQDV